MSCHLTCPTCHNKFFKISNMSMQNSRGDILKPVGATQKLRKSNSSELETVLRYNVQLEKENTTLRTEIHDLALKNDNLLQALNKNKEKFQGDFNNLQEEIRINEKQLVENSRKCLEQQNKLVDEIKKLKHENEDLKRQRNDVETFLAEKLTSLESEIKIMKLENENLRSSNRENEEKCTKYKMKLKHAVKIVNDLNKIIAEYERKPEYMCETTQTNWNNNSEKSIMLDCSQCGDPRFKRNLNSENLLLSDIFFKQKSFMDSEINLFSAKSKSRCSSKTKIR